MTDKDQILRDCITVWGVGAQVAQAAEESTELALACLHLLRDKSTREDIIEESGDVLLMIDQLKLILHITDEEIVEAQEAKLVRLETRLVEFMEGKV